MWEADLCLAMQMWGLKLQARLESVKALAAKLVIPREMHSQACVCVCVCGPVRKLTHTESSVCEQ